MNRLDAIQDDSDGSPGDVLASYSYLGLGTIVVEDYQQPDVRLEYFFDSAYSGWDRFGRVVDQRWYDYGASADRDRFTYGYDRDSNRLYRENPLVAAKDEFYSYDAVNRLATFDRGDLNVGKTAISGTPVKEEDWGLDMTGNWTDFLQKTSGSTDLNQDRTHNLVNEITGISETVGTAWVDPVHDKAGNLTTLPKPSSPATGMTCTWDAWNRLVEVKEGVTVVGRYEFDGLHRRVKSHVDSQSPGNPNGVDAYVHFFYNQGWQEFESRVSASENTGPESLQPQYQYVWSQRYIDAPVLRDKNTDNDGLCDDERIYYLGDANFNVTTLVNTGGDALERYVYSPYGVLTIYDATWANIRSTSSYVNAYTYTGRQFDTETGLYHYRARFYAAQLGEFVLRDSVRYRRDTNLYSFSRNAPTSYVQLSMTQQMAHTETGTMPQAASTDEAYDCKVTLVCARLGMFGGPKHCGIEVGGASFGRKLWHVFGGLGPTAPCTFEDGRPEIGFTDPGDYYPVVQWSDPSGELCRCINREVANFNGQNLKYTPIPRKGSCDGSDIGTCNSNYAAHCIMKRCNIDFTGWHLTPVGWNHRMKRCAERRYGYVYDGWGGYSCCRCTRYEVVDGGWCGESPVAPIEPNPTPLPY